MVEHVPDCPFVKNNSVGCALDDRKCDKCGWNPAVDEVRRQKTREKLMKEAANDKT